MAQKLTDHEGRDRTISHVALSGGVFQNEVLLELVTTELKEMRVYCPLSQTSPFERWRVGARTSRRRGCASAFEHGLR